MTDSTSAKQLVQRFLTAGNARDQDELRRILAPDFRRHCPATPDVVVRSADDFLAFLEADAATFPDSRVEVQTLVAEDDLVAFRATYSGTQHGPMGPFPPSGRPVRAEFAGAFRVAHGHIADLRVTWDNLDVLAQLGHVTPPL